MARSEITQRKSMKFCSKFTVPHCGATLHALLAPKRGIGAYAEGTTQSGKPSFRVKCIDQEPQLLNPHISRIREVGTEAGLSFYASAVSRADGAHALFPLLPGDLGQELFETEHRRALARCHSTQCMLHLAGGDPMLQGYGQNISVWENSSARVLEAQEVKDLWNVPCRNAYFVLPPFVPGFLITVGRVHGRGHDRTMSMSALMLQHCCQE